MLSSLSWTSVARHDLLCFGVCFQDWYTELAHMALTEQMKNQNDLQLLKKLLKNGGAVALKEMSSEDRGETNRAKWRGVKKQKKNLNRMIVLSVLQQRVSTHFLNLMGEVGPRAENRVTFDKVKWSGAIVGRRWQVILAKRKEHNTVSGE